MILVFGSTGRTGRALISQLLKKGEKLRIMVRNAKKVRELRLQGVDVVEGEIDNYRILSQAFERVDKVYMLLGNSEHQLFLEKLIINMALEKGVSLVVKQSSLEALPDSDKPIPKLHVESEQYLKRSGLNWVMLRPTFFSQMLFLCAEGIVKADKLAFPMLNGVVAMTDARDVAEVAAHVLTTSGHSGKSYDITGPELVSFETVAAILSKELGREITYTSTRLEDFRARLDQVVEDKWRVNAVCEEINFLANAQHGYTTSVVSDLLGRPARGARDFISDFRQAFTPE
ncbi:NmrA family NAD(P)-binding protein [Alteromonas sp. 1_MG-2023]|uniref:NmrA family NAD(P)-binding protein n=1 Tax=Alteromonas sp. 1_MG-2023 TaxID=3062669 RepID=UPI0026E48263|nr:NmrA family NAD(P)-binding protein [Alteromonas sp. 1_MG-2023]MDO6475146.1 NmrA family NAD(P)-binding protein [Alteromonas sp. 1_MG-2023]